MYLLDSKSFIVPILATQNKYKKYIILDFFANTRDKRNNEIQKKTDVYN